MADWDFSRAEWKKSTRSTTNNGGCVEVATVWRKSSRSGANGGSCVEVATTADHAVAVRDSKNPDGAILVFAPADWSGFLTGIRAGAFDLR